MKTFELHCLEKKTKQTNQTTTKQTLGRWDEIKTKEQNIIKLLRTDWLLW